MKYNHIGIPTNNRFEGEIDIPHLKITVSDHANNPFGIQWMRYWDDAPYPELIKIRKGDRFNIFKQPLERDKQ